MPEDVSSRPEHPAEERPLRIAMLGHKGIPARHGGIERHVEEIARRLVLRGHRVDVFNRPYHTYGASSYEGIRVRKRPSLPTKHLDAATHTVLCGLEVIGSRRYDILHLHGIGPGFFVPWSQPFLATVFTFHAQDWRQRKWGRGARWSLRQAERLAVGRADAVITVSRLLETYVRGVHGRQARYIPNGATPAQKTGTSELGRWGLEPGGYLLFVGRLISDRGLERLLEAYATIRDPRRLVIVGDVQHDRLHVQELRRRADSRVVFTGYQDGAVLQELYGNAYFCVHPSEVEGLPIAVLEAMSHGKTVLVSDIPENLEAVGETGARFPVHDTAGLVRVLERLLHTPGEVAERGRAALRRARQHFDWDEITRSTESVYEETFRLRRSGGRTQRTGRSSPT